MKLLTLFAESLEPSIGIDFGNTNSKIAMFVPGSDPFLIKNDEGREKTPSCVAFLKNGEIKVGDPAKRQIKTNPKGTIYSIKQLIGRRFDEVTEGLGDLNYNIVKGISSSITIACYGNEYSPEYICSLILKKLNLWAVDFVGRPLTNISIAVPAFFNKSQCLAIKKAGKLAGINIRHIVKEPIAAALAYFNAGKDKKDRNILVFDLGGESLDVSVLEIKDGIIELKSNSLDSFFGGNAFDKLIVEWLVDEFIKEEGVDLYRDPMAHLRLIECAEKAKFELSASKETEINLPYITAINGIPKHLVKKISRTHFEFLCAKLFDRLFYPCNKAIKNAGITISKLDEIILVGGGTLIPKVKELVQHFFNIKPLSLLAPDEVVALGTALVGTAVSKNVILEVYTDFEENIQDENCFISYSSSDKSFALQLAKDLKNEGANIWIDILDILPGAKWDSEIDSALAKSNCIIIILSSNSVKSENVLDEIFFGLREKKKLIPVLIDECEVPYRIARLQHVDFIVNYRIGFNQLAKRLNIVK